MSQPASSAPSRSRTALLCLTALGIVYGDIGTSPLYAMRECFHGEAALVNPASVMGVLSLIVWTITIMITLHYVMLVSRADQNGEGGMLALLCTAFPDRRNKGEWRSPVARVMVILGLFGATLLYGDGMITPAISVVAAVEGLKVAAPALSHWVVPVSVIIIVGIFSVQRFGTAKVGSAFGPITALWFLVLAVLGVFWIKEAPGVLQAFNPWLGIHFLYTHPTQAMTVLAGVFLTVTGGEALYADMGHFGRRPVVLSWLWIVKPALILNYLGQGALLIGNAHAIENPLQFMTPEWGRLPLTVLATLASIIASQALISGVFSLTMQAVQLGYLPRIRISHTSSSEHGQIYISKVNWLLMIGTILLVVGFGTSERLASAYGIALSQAMLVTTLLLFYAATRKWGWSTPRTIALISVQLVLNVVFVYSNSLKFFHGGWVPVVVAVVLFTIMVTWRAGRRVLGAKLYDQALPLNQFLESIERGKKVQRVGGTAVFLSGASGLTPTSLLHNLKHNKVLHERMLFLTIVSELHPYVTPTNRLRVEKLAEHVWRVTGHYGFMEQPDVPALLRACADYDLHFDPMQTSYFLGRETIIPTNRNLAFWRATLFAVMSRNAQSAVAYYNIPPSRVVEFGIQIEL